MKITKNPRLAAAYADALERESPFGDLSPAEAWTSGLLSLDAALGGSVCAGGVFAVHGEAGSGLTSFALVVAAAAAREGVIVVLSTTPDVPEYAFDLSGVPRERTVVVQSTDPAVLVGAVRELSAAVAIDFLIVDSIAAVNFDSETPSEFVAALAGAAGAGGFPVLVVDQNRARQNWSGAWSSEASTGKWLWGHLSARVSLFGLVDEFGVSRFYGAVEVPGDVRVRQWEEFAAPGTSSRDHSLLRASLDAGLLRRVEGDLLCTQTGELFTCAGLAEAISVAGSLREVLLPALLRRRERLAS